MKTKSFVTLFFYVCRWPPCCGHASVLADHDKSCPYDVPQVFLHVHAAIGLEPHALSLKERPLFGKGRGGTAVGGKDAVTGCSGGGGSLHDPPNEPGMIRPTGQAGNLSVGQHTARWNGADNLIYIFNKEFLSRSHSNLGT